ncbi:anhydro-N-acetylmuramic acid kinase [Comamonas flocculans]|uniref:Anhydro-N-acetylmuramic acid kinase n=1 Tax=Comamonas flocculans TaxID=2597701 RepID=A0A5B8RXQ2_9BURK|nr:anhydro-N-acetylmuramic acid kinase [Comamonas flocculans]QEA13418.1 anhydro-N-acetylmuramic acid kinase [Comamonas flocculans]
MRAAAASRYIGLMSGTSLDGIDGVLADFSQGKCLVTQHASAPLAPELRAELLALNTPGDNELHRAQLAANALARACAALVQQLLRQAALDAADIAAIGAHGQTVRHRPGAFDATGYTVQLNNPALLAELTGITVVADLRSRDLAAGGQGAPLVPAFHQSCFARPGQDMAVLNLGGMSNLTVLSATGQVRGWDCGPGNVLLDLWCQRYTGQPCDRDGALAASGQVQDALLRSLLTEPYFSRPAPKSTGRDLFNARWLQQHLAAAPGARVQDVQATLTELSAHCCAQDLRRHAPATRQLVVCGGGVRNRELMRRLQAQLPDVRVMSSDALGIAPEQVEAAAFAWLARQCLHGEPGNLPAVTGARGPRILGAIYPA